MLFLSLVPPGLWEAPTEIHDPERKLIMKNVPQQVDQSPITNPSIKQEDWIQKEESLLSGSSLAVRV